MNRIFNLIWSKTKEKWIVVSEKVKGNGKVPSSPLLSIAVLTALFSSGGVAYGIDASTLPTGGQITSGSGTITSSGATMTINQATQQLIANWSTFDIGQNAAVRFEQPGIAAVALNRIADRNPSQIMGSLTSNGQVFLLNSSGIIFGKTATVNVGGLVASSLNLLDSDFLAGNNTFRNNGSSGAILNQGEIKALNGGVVALMAPKVTNEGSITANSGSVLLAAGNQVTLDFTGDGLINYTVDQGAVDALVENKGLIKADGGVVVMTAKAADALRMATASNSGVIEARTLQNKAGRILLLSDMENGQALVSGILDASAPNGGDGGFIETSGGRVKISDGTIVTTKATQGKTGTWLIDPTDFTITGDSAPRTDSGMGATTLATDLLLTDVIIETSDAGAQLGDINVNADVVWFANTLTLTAHHNINVNAVMTAIDAKLVLNYGWNGLTGGAETYGASGTNLNMGFNLDGTFKGRVDFFEADGITPRSGNSFLSINGHSYNVINDLGLEGSIGTDLQGINGGLGGYYALGSNIDASDTSGWAGGFTPIGFDGNYFSGIFDGLGHTISDLTIDRPGNDQVGLFGDSYGTIRNVGLTNASVTGYGQTGALVGYNQSGTIANSFAKGVVNSTYNYGEDVGGLVGSNVNGPISNSYAAVDVTVSGEHGESVGGLVGHNSNGTITSSYATGQVLASGNYTNSVGGLVGSNSDGTITSSYATGAVTGKNSVGGLVGYNYNGTITDSSVSGNNNVTGNDSVGGLVGYNHNGTITNSFVTGNRDVSGVNDIGGLVGYQDGGSITDSHADTGTGKVSGSSYDTGGLVGHDYNSTITRSHSSAIVDGYSTVGGLVGYQDRGSITDSYATGSVTGDRYNAGGLVGSNHYGTITGSHSSAPVDGHSNVGGLVGSQDYGSISDSYATGSVTGDGHNVGGLVGYRNGNSTITNSFYDMRSPIKIGDHEGGTLIAAVTPYGINGTLFDDWLSTADGKTAKTLDITKYFDISGDGYYEITKMTGSLSDKGDLRNILGFVNDTNTNKFRLTNSLNLAGTGFWIPLFNATELDGNNQTLSGLTINQPMNDSIGMIGYLGSGSTIKDLGLGRVDKSVLPTSNSVTGDDDVGGLIGYNDGGTITNTYTTGEVTGSAYHAGGLVGHNQGGSITGSSSSATVNGDYGVGGLVGYMYGGSITDSHAAGNVTGSSSNVGGLVGSNDYSSGTITGSYATGDVKQTGGEHVGGLVGLNNGTITDSYATGDVTGSLTDDHYDTGGLVGQNYGAITNSYATGDVTGVNHVGGLVGHNEPEGGNPGTITDSYATGDVTGSGYGVGGLVGYTHDGTITNSFYNMDTATILVGNNDGSGGTVKAEVTPFGINGTLFDDWLANGKVLNITDYFSLLGGYYQITKTTGSLTDKGDLRNILGFVNDSHAYKFKLTTNISLPSGFWIPLFNADEFDGNGKIFTGLTINQPMNSEIGMIGDLGQANPLSTIKNLGVTGIDLTGHDYVGGLVGDHYGTTTNSYASGSVVGTGDYVGGLVGSNYGGITSSHATGSVEGNDYVGGLVGSNYGTITSSYATGSVEGSDYVGGLVGYNEYGTISSSYATGNVEGSDFIGGLVGNNDSGNITDSHATGTVTGNDYVGGLVGYNTSDGTPITISNSYATGSVTGTGNAVGGLVGYNDNYGTINNSYASGDVTSTGGRIDYVGGLVGWNEGDITSSHATGAVTMSGDYGEYAGGLVGYNDGNITSSYATGSVHASGYDCSYVGGLVGYNDGDITGSHATGSVTVTGDSGDYIGGLVGYNDGYISNTYATGNVNTLSADEVGGLVGHNCDTLENSHATGNVTGDDKVGGLAGSNDSDITDSYATGNVTGSDYVGGLVGNSSGCIARSYATGDVEGSGDYVGGLVGNSDDDITDSYATGNVTGDDHVGGLVGYNDYGITRSYATGNVTGDDEVGGLVGHNCEPLTESYATGNVTGDSYVGGLVGDNDDDITDSYATGNVTGNNYVGGLVGNSDGDGYISNTYARGLVTGTGYDIGALVGEDSGDISHSYYESGVNPSLTGVGNEDDAPGYVWGMSTANMKLVENYTSATDANGNPDPGPDWRFYLTPVLKAEVIWKIDADKNDGYPYLAWQTLSPKTPPDRPPVLDEPKPVDDPSFKGAPTTPPPLPITEGQFLKVEIIAPPSGAEPGLIGVSVPQDLWKPGAVFSFELPEQVKGAASGGDVAITMLDGSPSLPLWLHYNPETMTFTATDIPEDASGVKILVTINGKSWVVDVSMKPS